MNNDQPGYTVNNQSDQRQLIDPNKLSIVELQSIIDGTFNQVGQFAYQQQQLMVLIGQLNEIKLKKQYQQQSQGQVVNLPKLKKITLPAKRE